MQNDQVDMHGASTISHPYSEYTAADAINLANGNRSLNILPPVVSLREAREVVKDMLDRAESNWITGLVAMDVLDAAIDNRDLKLSCRII